MGRQLEPAVRSGPATRASYVLLYAFGLSVGLPGPAVPSLQQEYGLSYAGAALHLTLFSAGSAIASLVDDRLGRLWDRAMILRGTLIGVAVGATFCGIAPNAGVSLLGVSLLGFCATVAMNVAHGVIGSEHGGGGGTAMINGHLCAAIGLVSAAVAIAAARALGEWRLAFLVPVLVAAVVLLGRLPRRMPARAAGGAAGPTRRKPTPAPVRTGGVVLALAVTVEWAVMFWAASYLRDPIGLAPGLADVATIAVLATMVLGRWGLSQLSRRYDTVVILRVAMVATTAASLPYLAGPLLTEPLGLVVPVVALAVLCVLVSALFPLGLTMTLAAAGRAPAEQQQASAVALSMGAISAIAAPYMLGSVADAASLTIALMVLPLGAVLALAGIARMRRQTAAPAGAVV